MSALSSNGSSRFVAGTSLATRRNVARGLLWFAAALWAFGILLHLVFPPDGLETVVTARVKGDRTGLFQVYFADDPSGFRADRKAQVTYEGGGWRTVSVRMPVFRADSLRVDTHSGPSHVFVESLFIRTPGHPRAREIPLEELEPLTGPQFDAFSETPRGWEGGDGDRIPAPLVWKDLPDELFPFGSGLASGFAWHAYQATPLRFLLLVVAVSLAGYLVYLPATRPLGGWPDEAPPGAAADVWMNRGSVALLRWGAVLLVVMNHAYGRLGQIESQPLWPWILAGPMSAGNTLFLGLSGFLAARSLSNNPSTLRFLVRRGVRLLPLLWIFSIGIVLVLGPSLTEAPWREYFSSEGFRRLLATGWISPDGTVTLPGFLRGGAVNPALYIFPAFLYGYVLLWFLSRIGLLRPVRFLAVVAGFAVAVGVVLVRVEDIAPFGRLFQLNAVVVGAAAGLFYPRLRGWGLPLLGFLLFAAVSVWLGPFHRWTLLPAAVAAAFLFVGVARIPVRVAGIPLAGAYCFFPVHWPVQSVLQIVFEPTSGFVFFAGTVVLVFGIAALVQGTLLDPVERRADGWLAGRLGARKR